MYGNWCNGSIPDVSIKDVPLKNIFYLNQSYSNHAYLIDKKILLYKEMFKSIVKPFAGKAQWHQMFDLMEHMVDKTDCYLLNFNLDGKITKIIKDII